MITIETKRTSILLPTVKSYSLVHIITNKTHFIKLLKFKICVKLKKNRRKSDQIVQSTYFDFYDKIIL